MEKSPEEGDRPAVVDAGVRLRYTEGGLRAEERRGRGVQSGGTASGGRRFGGFGAKPPPTSGKRKASATTSEGSKMDGLMGWQRSWACRFRWFGPQNHHRLICTGRGLDKIETLKVTGGHVVGIARLRRS